MGLLFVSKFFIKILDLSLIIVPFHLLGLKGLIGDIDNFLEFKLTNSSTEAVELFTVDSDVFKSNP